jgi:DNA-binding NarL/FixJ family response regulator
VDPDVVLADTVMPGRTGFEICQYLKMSPRHKHVRVVLTAGVLETLDADQIRRVEADGMLKKPFEASVLIATVKPLAEAAAAARAETLTPGGAGKAPVKTAPAAPFIAVVDAEQVRAAVTVALDASMAAMVDEIAARVLSALSSKKPADAMQPPEPAPLAASAPAQPAAPAPATAARAETVRRVSSLRMRSGSILGLEISRPEPETPPDPPSGPDSH